MLPQFDPHKTTWTLDELQEERNAWVAHNFPPTEAPFSDLADSTLGVCEEAGELAHAVLKWKQGIRGTPEEHRTAAIDSCGDIFVYLAGVAKNAGFTLQEALDAAWSEVRTRDWIKNPTDGKVE